MFQPNPRFISSLSLLAGAVALCLSTPAQAVPPKTGRSPEYKQAVMQADGITNRVLDKLIVKSDRYFHDGDYNRTIGTLRIVVEGDPDYNDGYENAAYLLWSQGYTPAADAILQYGLTRTKEKGELSYEFGWHLYNTKRYAQAEPYLAKAVTYPRTEPRWYAVLGHCYEKNGKMPQAVATWRTLVKKFPNFPSGPPNLRSALAKQSRSQ